LVCSRDKRDTVTLQNLAKGLDLLTVTPGRFSARHIEPQVNKNEIRAFLLPQAKEVFEELRSVEMGVSEILRAERLCKRADIGRVLP
jgi:hypothetical protein